MMAAGVPVIVPVYWLNSNPEGTAGVIVYNVIRPPLDVGVGNDAETPTVYVSADGVYDKEVGGVFSTRIAMYVVVG